MFTVYQPRSETIKNGMFDPRDRVVFYQGGRALLYRECTLLNPAFNPSIAKKCFKKIKEQPPQYMNAFGRVTDKIVNESLPIPFAVFSF